MSKTKKQALEQQAQGFRRLTEKTGALLDRFINCDWFSGVYPSGDEPETILHRIQVLATTAKVCDSVYSFVTFEAFAGYFGFLSRLTFAWEYREKSNQAEAKEELKDRWEILNEDFLQPLQKRLEAKVKECSK